MPLARFGDATTNQLNDNVHRLAIGDVAKSLFKLAGIRDAWGFARGNTQTKVNYAMATFEALRMTSTLRVTEEQAKTESLNNNIVYGKIVK